MKIDAKSTSIALIAVILVALFYSAMTTREHRTLGQKLDAAAGQLDNGVDNAARELKDRTPAERVKDEVKDATDTDK